MITFHKRKENNNEIVETNDRNDAIYFCIDNGALHPISSLTDEIVAANKGTGNNIHLDNAGNEIVSNVPANDGNLPEPLLMPKMNFDKPGKDKEDKEDEYLPLPSMSFE